MRLQQWLCGSPTENNKPLKRLSVYLYERRRRNDTDKRTNLIHGQFLFVVTTKREQITLQLMIHYLTNRRFIIVIMLSWISFVFKENSFALNKKNNIKKTNKQTNEQTTTPTSRRYPAETITDAEYIVALVLLVSTLEPSRLGL